jgi:hypothetical protein
MLSATAQVSASVPDPLHRDRLRRWLVTLDLLAVHEGEPPDGSGVLTLLVHSPSRDFRDPEIVGHVYRIELTDPPVQPYTGTFSVERADSG